VTLRQTCKRQVGIVRQEKKPNDAAPSGSEAQRCKRCCCCCPASGCRAMREMICREGNVQDGLDVVGALRISDRARPSWGAVKTARLRRNVVDERSSDKSGRVAPKHQRRAEPDVVRHAATWSRESVECPVIRLMTRRRCTEYVVSARLYWAAAADTWAGVSVTSEACERANVMSDCAAMGR